MNKTLFLIRGLPGSGKSTLAAKLASEFGCTFFEADMYFINGSNYVFNPATLYYAHKWCQVNVFQQMYDRHSVIVSNTFTTYKEIQPYIKKANALDYRVVIVHCISQFENTHHVPEETIQRMKDRLASNDDLVKLIEQTKDMSIVTGTYDPLRDSKISLDRVIFHLPEDDGTVDEMEKLTSFLNRSW